MVHSRHVLSRREQGGIVWSYETILAWASSDVQNALQHQGNALLDMTSVLPSQVSHGVWVMTFIEIADSIH